MSPAAPGGATVARPLDGQGVRDTLPPGEVRAMFDRIARRYDLLNRLMTLGLDRGWRRRAAAAADLAAGQAALDCCTGTGDLAFELADRVTPLGRVVGIDFAEAMLERARAKAARQGRGPEVCFEVADAEALPFADGAFDAATSAFGMRNVEDLDRALAEMARVVRPGGRLVVLEISGRVGQEPSSRSRALAAHGARRAEAWFDRVVPALGALVARDGAAYRYLPASSRRFPAPAELAARLAAAGLEDIRWRTFVGGLVALHHGRVA